MSASVDGGSSNKKALFVGIIVLLAIAIGVLLFSIIRRQKAPSKEAEVPSPTKAAITIVPKIPTPTEVTELVPLTPVTSTDEASLSPTPTQDIGSPADESPIGGTTLVTNTPTPTGVTANPTSTRTPTTPVSTTSPELPSAGLPIPILLVGFLGIFVLLVGFVL